MTTQRHYEDIAEMTPWGKSHGRTQYGPGVVFYDTASHGGFKLSLERLATLRAKFGSVKTYCGQPNWFEEDCDWAYVALTFPEMFNASELEHAQTTLDCVSKWKAEKAEVAP